MYLSHKAHHRLFTYCVALSSCIFLSSCLASQDTQKAFHADPDITVPCTQTHIHNTFACVYGPTDKYKKSLDGTHTAWEEDSHITICEVKTGILHIFKKILKKGSLFASKKEDFLDESKVLQLGLSYAHINKLDNFWGVRVASDLSINPPTLPSCFKSVHKLPHGSIKRPFSFQRGLYSSDCNDYATDIKDKFSSTSFYAKYELIPNSFEQNIYRETTIQLNKLSVVTKISNHDSQVITDKFFHDVSLSKDRNTLLFSNPSNFLLFGSHKAFGSFIKQELRTMQPLFIDNIAQIILEFLPDFNVKIEGTLPYGYNVKEALISNNDEIFMEFDIEGAQSACYQLDFNDFPNDSNPYNPSWTDATYHPLPAASSISFT